MDRDQTGQRASAGRALARLAGVAGWVLAAAGQHEAVPVARLGVGVVAGSTAADEHQEEGHGINPASASSSGSASAGIDQLADAVASAHRLPRRLSQEAASGCPV